jgi:hypothetical protein
MISMYLATKPPSRVDYCPVTTDFLLVNIFGRTILDTSRGFVKKGWLKQLINFVIENSYNVESKGGTPAFVRGLASQGHLRILK